MEDSTRAPFYTAELRREAGTDLVHVQGPSVDLRTTITPDDVPSLEDHVRGLVAAHLGVAPDAFDIELITDNWPDVLPPTPATPPGV